MKFAALVLAFICLLPSAGYAQEWQQEKGDHFIVYYASDPNFAKKTVRQAEVYYGHIADEIGYPRYSNFWTWDNRVKIYLYPDEAAFHKGTDSPEWMKGVASYKQKAISTFAGCANFIDGILPHETTHLIFRDFVGFKGAVPLWIDEGIAQWEEPQKRALARKVARALVQKGMDRPLAELTRMDVRHERDEDTVRDFYMQAVSLVDYLVKTYGPQSFTEFCRELRDGKDFEDALRAAYPGVIETVNDLDTKWREYASKE